MLHERTTELLDRLTPHPAPPAVVSQPDDPRLDLKELIQVIRRRQRTILWTAAIPLVLALAYSLLATPLYTASTQILIDPRDRRIVTNEVTPETLAADGGIAVVESQLLVISSDTVLRRAIVREHLDVDSEFGGPSTGLLANLRSGMAAFGLDLFAADRSDPELIALRQLKKRIGVKRSDKAYVVDVYVTTETRDKSVRVANAIAQAYLDDQANARATASERASNALSGRLDALRSRLQEAEDRAVQYREQHKILAAGGVLVNEQQLSEINAQLNAARGKTAEARARYEQTIRARAAGTDSGAVPEAVLSQTIGQLRTQYAEVARQRAEFGALVGPRHPSITNLDAQIRSLQKLIDEELGRITTAARSELERAQASERALEANLDSLKQSANSTNQASVRLRELEREVEASRAVYQAFLTRARETSEQQSIDNTNVRIISKATLPRDKSWPPRLLLIAVALVAGLGMGTGVGLMREYLDERVYSRRPLQAVTGVPVVAVVPSPAYRVNRWNMLAGSIRLRWRQPVGTHGEAEIQPATFNAAMRRLRDALSNHSSPHCRIILMTSAKEGEGRTTTALNLALNWAASGLRVLLIDADIKRGGLSRTLDAAGNAGLFDLLEGRATLASVVLTDTETGLSFLPHGNATRPESYKRDAQELARKLFDPARGYDIALLDCGAVLSDDYVRFFADLADDIVFIVRAGGPTKDEIAASFDALRINGRKVRGTVLTGAASDAA